MKREVPEFPDTQLPDAQEPVTSAGAEGGQDLLGISIFTCNDGETIEDVIHSCVRELSAITGRYQVLVVNDGSADDTGERAERLAADNPRVRVLHHPHNQGFGATIREACQIPTSAWVLVLPGDGQVSASVLPVLYAARHGFDFLLGRRARRNDPWVRQLNSSVYNLLVSLVAHRRIRDVNSVPFFDRRVLAGVELQSRSAFIHAEILLGVLKAGYRFGEVEIGHLPRRHGEASGDKASVILPTIRELLQYAMGRRR